MKRHCKARAEWRLQLGKPTERLSEHYRLDCDYGTAIVVCWEEGGSEPINLCEKHAKELERSGASRPPVRATTPTPAAPSARDNNPARSVEPTATQEVVHAKPRSSVSTETPTVLANTNAARTMKDSPVKSPARDVTYGNPVKALVDETIWNMATGDLEVYTTALREGKSAAEAAQAAGGQLAVVHRKIGEYKLKLEAVLSESKAILSVRDAIDRPLEQALLEIISTDSINEPDKDADIQQLGILEAWVKRGLHGDMTPLEANRIVREIGDRLNWGGSADISEELKPAYRALFASLKSAIYAAVPEAQNPNERLINLYAAKSELENKPVAKELNPVTA